MTDGLSTTPKTFVSNEAILISATFEDNGLISILFLFYIILEGIMRVVKSNHLQQSFSNSHLQMSCINIMWKTIE